MDKTIHRLGQHYFKYSYLQVPVKYASSVCRIGCSSGFWGDTAVAATQLVSKGDIHFLVADYLSEITMSLLAAMKSKNSTLGYVPDFLQAGIGPCLKTIQQKGIRVVTNAGGLNVRACAEAVRKAAVDINWNNIKVATVYGDDMLQTTSEQMANSALKRTSSLPSPNNSLNAYLGAGGIKAALDNGADVVITGRCVDSALVLGPLMHMFQWSPDDYDKLAYGSLAGHLIECGAQVTGGIYTDHRSVPDWCNIGFPIVECESNGHHFTVTKPNGTGGLVNRGTVCEQLVYEIDDPRAYRLPDVYCDFTQVTVDEIAENCVRVSGARGYAPQEWKYKVTGTQLDGYRLTAGAIVMGKDAVHKAHRTSEEILKRVRGILKMLKLADFRKTHIQVIGAEESYAKSFRICDDQVSSIREVCLWLAAEHENKTALEILSREIAPAGTGMAPGLTTLVGSGRPKVSPVFRMDTSYVLSSAVPVSVHMNGDFLCHVPSPGSSEKQEGLRTLSMQSSLNNSRRPSVTSSSETVSSTTSTMETQRLLSEIAWLRSGDKGDNCNIGVIARRGEDWNLLKQNLTEEKVGAFFSHHFPDGQWSGLVKRYELEGIKALNFVLSHVLDGGGVSSLRPDPQGKAFAQMLAELRI